MDSIGDTLRRERIRQGVRLEQVAAQTKIVPRLIEAMEENRFDRLPGGLFTRSFLRQYANALGLDEEGMMASFREQFQEPPLSLPIPAIRRSSHIPYLPAAGWLLVVLIGCGAIYSFWENVRRSMPTTSAAHRSPTSNAAVGTGLVQLPDQIVQAAPIQTPAADVRRRINLDAVPPTGQATALISGLGGALHVQFTATEQVWVSIKSDGAPTYSGMLEVQQTKQFDAAEKMTVLVGNAGGLRIAVNGTPVAPIGSHGEVQLVVLTPQGAKVIPRTSQVPSQPREQLSPVNREDHG